MKRLFGTCLTLAFLMFGAQAFAQGIGRGVLETDGLQLGTPFRDNAILQRQMPVPVWGWSKPGSTVTVEFAGQTKKGKAGKDGKWMVELDPLEASSEPRKLTVRSTLGPRPLTLSNVLVGEVWMCSGQSNMQWLVNKSIVGRKLVPELEARVKEGKEPRPIIREGKVTNVFSSLYPTERAQGRWSENWQDFSAIAFAFAYDVAKELQVPVGIVNCAFSTTKIQAWIPREGFAAGEDEYTKALYHQILESDYRTPEHKEAWDQFEQELKAWAKESAERIEKGLSANPRPGVPGNMNGNRDSTWMCNGKIMPMAPYAIRGAIWNQGFASQSEGVVYRNNLHSLVRGWRTVFRNPDLPVYFHQFYVGKGGSDGLSLSNTAEMRLGTWLAHRDIPNAAMASQIDITGSIHYFNKAVPGQRLARHALKNQYGKKLIANGPMYKGYKVKGRKMIVELDHAEGLQVGNSNCGSGFADPTPIENGEEQVTFFYLADEEMTWHRARVEIKGETIVLTADGLKKPRGVAYGWNGVGKLPSIYNKAMLPLTPFMVYDHKFVISDQWVLDHIKMDGSVTFFTWPMAYVPVAGKEVDPKSYGLQYENRKLWLLGPQFANNAVIQAGVPTRFYGKALPGSVVRVSFNGVEKSITMDGEEDEWELEFPAMEATAKPQVFHASCTLDGALVHERKLQNVVIGDVWYVAANELKMPRGPGVPRQGPTPLEAWTENPQLRMFMSYGRREEAMPTRFKMNASGYPRSRAFARWSPTIGLARELAERIHAKTGKPVGIIVLDPGKELPIKAWTGYEFLSKIPAWKSDAEELSPFYTPNPQAYITRTEAYIGSWREYWQSVKTDPGFQTGGMPRFPGPKSPQTIATRTYNQSICAFSPGNFKAILCVTGKGFVADDEGAAFGEQLSVMANSWKHAFARGKEALDPHFVYALPGDGLAAKTTAPSAIKGKSTAVKIDAWPSIKTTRVKDQPDKVELNKDLQMLIEAAVDAVY